MPKTLILIRHAKSSWDDPFLADIARPLAERGLKDAPNMAKFIFDEGIRVDYLLSSPAERAYSTARFFAAAYGLPQSAIETDEAIYHAGSRTLMKVVRSLPDQHGTMMLFGHNPGFTDFANELAKTNIANIPTCGVLGVRFEVDKWHNLAFGKGYKVFYYTPKNI